MILPWQAPCLSQALMNLTQAEDILQMERSFLYNPMQIPVMIHNPFFYHLLHQQALSHKI